MFVVHGLLFASWTAHIPGVKAHLGLTDGMLGFALLGAPAGSVTAMIAASWLLPRVGSRRIVQVALVGYCAAGPLVGLTGSLPALVAALFVWGAFQGTLDVAMNTQAIAVERTGRRALMSGLHGGWSIGSFAGAGLGALAVAAHITLSVQLLGLGTIALLVAGLLTTRMLPAAVEQPGDLNAAAGSAAAGRRPPGRVSRWSGGMVLLGAIAFAAMLCEGATADWSAVYLSGSLHARGVVPGLGYAVFALAMVTVRLSGNRLLTRFRPDRLLPALAAVATAGFGQPCSPASRPPPCSASAASASDWPAWSPRCSARPGGYPAWPRAPPWPPRQPADGPDSSAAHRSSGSWPRGLRCPSRWACCPCSPCSWWRPSSAHARYASLRPTPDACR